MCAHLKSNLQTRFIIFMCVCVYMHACYKKNKFNLLYGLHFTKVNTNFKRRADIAVHILISSKKAKIINLCQSTYIHT